MNVINLSLSDRGIKKPVNQDRIINCLYEQNGHSLFLGGIFDGISSLKDSEYMAEQAANTFTEWFESLKEWVDLSAIDIETLGCHLLDVLDEVSDSIYEMRHGGEYNGGTTASIILILDNYYNVYHVGDSKVFLLRNQMATQLTEDQKRLGQVNGITRFFLPNYLGKNAECDYLKYYGWLEQNDALLYGSDGFFEELSNQELVLINMEIGDTNSAERVLKEYIEQLKQRGEKDNISIGIYKLD